MSEAFTQFEQRLSNLERKHKRLAKGYVARIDPNGLIRVAPKRHAGRTRARLLAGIILGFFVFKIMTLIIVGPVTYESRVEELRAGTIPEQISAWIMQADPLSEKIAKYIISFAR